MTMKRAHIRLTLHWLAIGPIAALTVVMVACSSLPSSPANTTSQPRPSPTAQTGSSTQNAVVNLPSFADLLTVAELSVVEIDTSGTTTGRRRTVVQQGSGSGWIMRADGMIVTNNHVIQGASTINVTTFDGKTFPAQVVNTDAASDLAVLKINATRLQSIN